MYISRVFSPDIWKFPSGSSLVDMLELKSLLYLFIEIEYTSVIHKYVFWLHV